MKNKDDKSKHKEVEDLNPKSKYRDQFTRKRNTQQTAKERRQLIREIREDQDWN